eukprot:366024-Chlamydomonas_euryale.AAC.19
MDGSGVAIFAWEGLQERGSQMKRCGMVGCVSSNEQGTHPTYGFAPRAISLEDLHAGVKVA